MHVLNKITPNRTLKRSLDAIVAANEAKAHGSAKQRAKARAAVVEARSQLATAAAVAPRPPASNWSNARQVRILEQLDAAALALEGSQ